MAQVNVAYDDGLLRHLDAMAAKRGLSSSARTRPLSERIWRSCGRSSERPKARPDLPCITTLARTCS
jgi:hypothetical protein